MAGREPWQVTTTMMLVSNTCNLLFHSCCAPHQLPPVPIFGQNLPFCINICAMSKRVSNCKGALSTLLKLDSNRRERSRTCTITLQFWSTNWHNFSREVESEVADCSILMVWIINALLYWLHIFATKHTSFCVAGNIYRYHLKKKKSIWLHPNAYVFVICQQLN